MTSGCTSIPDLLDGAVARRFEDGPRLHLGRARGGVMREAAAAVTEHRVGLVQLLDLCCFTRSTGHDARSSVATSSTSSPSSRGKELVQRADPAVRTVTGRPPMRPEQAVEVARAAWGSSLSIAFCAIGRPCRPGSSRRTWRASGRRWKNMCSVRQRPMPSAPNAHRLFEASIRRDRRSCPHPRAFVPRRPSVMILA